MVKILHFLGYQRNGTSNLTRPNNANRTLPISEQNDTYRSAARSRSFNDPAFTTAEEYGETPPLYSSVTTGQEADTTAQFSNESALNLDRNGPTYQTLRIFSLVGSNEYSPTPPSYSSATANQDSNTNLTVSTNNNDGPSSISYPNNVLHTPTAFSLFVDSGNSPRPPRYSSVTANQPANTNLHTREINNILLSSNNLPSQTDTAHPNRVTHGGSDRLPSYSSVTSHQNAVSHYSTVEPIINDDVIISDDNVIVIDVDDDEPPPYEDSSDFAR